MLKSRSQTLPNQINMIEHLILSSVVKLIVQDVRKQPLNSHLWSRFYVQCRESLKDDCNQGSFAFLWTTKSAKNACASSYIIHHSLVKKSPKDVQCIVGHFSSAHLHQWHDDDNDDNDDMLTV